MRLVTLARAFGESQRHTSFLWAPVLLGVGIAGYFALPAEPPLALALAAGGLGALALLARLRLGRFTLAALAGMALIGFAAARIHTGLAAAPVLAETYFGPVTGRVVGLDRSQRNRVRVRLDRVSLPGLDPAATPRQVRLVLGGFVAQGALAPGARVMARARLTPPPPPVEPDGFDFRRHAWFARLGAIGFTAEPLVLAAPRAPPDGLLRVFGWRMALADGLRARMPARSGGFAAAILTGDRSTVDPADLADLRASNLAHLLAISGLHMGLLTGFVFAVLRFGIALIPPLALRLPAKKVAAVGALMAGAGYLALSGAGVATQRAFVMAAVILAAVLIDRPALTLRAVAVAAMIVLLLRPVSLLSAGFQMSFAATTALVAIYAWLKGQGWWRALDGGGWRFAKPVLAVVITSAVAGLATAPLAAFHFNRIAQFGLIANVLAVPVMGLLVMPAAVLALLLWPFGLEGLGLGLMRLGIDHILNVAGWIGGLEGATRPVPSGPDAALAALSAGGLMLVILRGRARAAGLAPLIAGLTIWVASPRPDVLIAPNGRLVGVMSDGKRTLNRPRGEGFAARVWLENDGDDADQSAAFGRGEGKTGQSLVRLTDPKGVELVWSGADTAGPVPCSEGTILVAPELAAPPSGRCLFIGAAALKAGGAMAIYGVEPSRLVTARQRTGNRPWTGAAQ